MTVLHYDIESYSECDLRDCGVYKYAEDPSTEMLCMSYRFDKGPVWLWIPHLIHPTLLQQLHERLNSTGRKGVEVRVGAKIPALLREHIEAQRETRAHNHQFERVVMNDVAGRKLGFPHVKIEQTVCTASKCAAAGLPRALGDACTAMGTAAKDDAGRIAMLQVTKPRKPTKDNPDTRWTPENAPDKFLDLWVYNVDDTIAESALDAVVPDLTAYELNIYHLSDRINERGVLSDLPGVGNVKALISEYKTFLEIAHEKATRPVLPLGCSHCNDTRKVEKILHGKPTGVMLDCPDCRGLDPTQREKIADWIRANGWKDLYDMQAETVKLLVKRDDVPENVKHVLRIYSTYNAKAVAKFDTILDSACADGRLRGMFMYHGAGTGRWSSMGIQLQNLFKGVIDDPETAIKAFSSRNLEWIKALYPTVDPMKVFASTVRGHLIAPKGKKLICCDYAGVESRMNAWLWDEQWKLDAFKAFDEKRGPDSYCIAYCDVFGGDPRTIGKKDYRRQWGKVIDLFGQYEGGVGAFVNLADQYGVNLSELADQLWPVLQEDVIESAEWMWNKFGRGSELSERVYMACDGAKQLWRRQHPGTVDGWKELKNAAEMAVQFPGQVYQVAKGKGMFKVETNDYGHQWLSMLLPSRRRKLRYFAPEWTPPKTIVVIEERHTPAGVRKVEVEKEIPGELHYMGVDTNTRRWMRTSSYGGAWNNNFVQGSCADVLRDGMLALEEGQYPIILTVHDEDGSEVDEAFGSVEEACALMCGNSPWAAGMPLVAEGWAGPRYKK